MQNAFHQCCKVLVIVVVDSLLLKKVGWDEVFRARTTLVLLTYCAAKSASNCVRKHDLWKQTVSTYTYCWAKGIIWIATQHL